MEAYYKQVDKDFYKMINELKSQKKVTNQELADKLGFRDISHFMTFIQKAYIKPEDMQRIVSAIESNYELLFIEKESGVIELKLIEID